jgi:hypothetical protein
MTETAKVLPQTADAIAEYVLLHFPESNAKSIYNTMLSGRNFVQFQNKLFGLAGKEYPPEYQAIDRKNKPATVLYSVTN